MRKEVRDHRIDTVGMKGDGSKWGRNGMVRKKGGAECKETGFDDRPGKDSTGCDREGDKRQGEEGKAMGRKGNGLKNGGEGEER